jgi:hypothetical protein
MWDIPPDVAEVLKRYTGEIKSSEKGLKDKRRMFFTEMGKDDIKKVVNFFNKNKILIVSDLVKGRGIFSAGWMLVVLKTGNKTKWVLKSINHALNIFAEGDVVITKQGNLKIGQIGMQRKGGDNGRNTANMLQFKANPLKLFEDQ